ncbi:MAG TPA: enhanced serine sensitivity protein SseB C-terminal domain-containing protein [Stellaceae bacterium]|nr:enhanced serine sensitivity protein SseB C-terminal domain-containing protein [Stellaceae bacterium]
MWPFKRTRKPDELPVSGLRFLGEQDGEPERRLKNGLTDLLNRNPNVRRAYLARAVNDGEPTVMLCIATLADEPDESLPREVGKIVAAIFSATQHLDILFPDDTQEARLAAVCVPFYRSIVSN